MKPDHKPWTKAEMRLIGSASDAAVARRIGRTPRAVAAKRRELGQPPAVPHRRSWTRRELKLLGTISDAQLAARLGCGRLTVLKKRRAMGIPPARPGNTPKKFRGRWGCGGDGDGP